MILFGSTLSPFVRKVLVFAQEAGIALELQGVRIGDENPDFRAASPFAKMPALQDGDFGIADSTAIVHYLDARQGGTSLIPSEPRDRARVVFWDEVGDTILFPGLAPMFFNRVVSPLFIGRPGDEAAASKAEAELPAILDRIEAALPDSDYLVADRLTLADIALASGFVNHRHLGGQLDPDRHPRLAAHVGRTLARPSFAALIAKDERIIARAREAAG